MAKKPVAVRRPGIVSFFSGCGVLDLGFEDAGFRTYLANELDPDFADAYEHSRRVMRRDWPVRGGVVRGGIGDFFGGHRRALLEGTMGEAREESGMVGFVGGPPCPDFSIAGKQAGGGGDKGRLTLDYFDLIGMCRPDFFLFENVRGLRSTEKHRLFFDGVLARAAADGYAMSERTVNALDFGVPQERFRVIVVGFHRGSFADAGAMASSFGWDAGATHLGLARGAGWPASDVLARDAETGEIDDAPRPPPPGLDPALLDLTVQSWFERNRVEEHPNSGAAFQVRSGLANMRRTAEGDTSRKSFKRLHRWRYAPTMAFGNNEVPLHPCKDRRISVAEALALQSLPPEFELPGEMTLSAAFKTIGNGVPYLLARGLASSVLAAVGNRAATARATDPARARTPVPSADAEAAPDLFSLAA